MPPDPEYWIEPLRPSHDRTGFHSGVAELDEYLHRQASQDARRNVAAPFALVDARDSILGYLRCDHPRTAGSDGAGLLLLDRAGESESIAIRIKNDHFSRNPWRAGGRLLRANATVTNLGIERVYVIYNKVRSAAGLAIASVLCQEKR